MSRYTELEINVSEEHAKDVQKEFDILTAYPDIIGGEIPLTDDIPIGIFPPRIGEKSPSVVLYDQNARPFIHIFNAEMMVTEDEVVFSTFYGGWVVSYAIGNEEENPEQEEQEGEEGGDGTVLCVGLEEGEEEEGEGKGEGTGEEEEHDPSPAEGESSWSWEMRNGTFCKVRK